ncbi:MAG: alpha-2-macroglobulin family protein [Gammaproteobacteria bacterium]|nr:MAG: alpha-2-macroglobulin family protein [Gammaproteobacteria bacterium]
MRNSTGARRLLVAVTAGLLFAACQRQGDEVPVLQTGPPIDARPAVSGFALQSAGRGFAHGDLALQLEFSQPLVASQAFDQQLAVTGPGGAAVSGSWVLDDGARVLRFPYVEADQNYTVRIRGTLAATDGATLGRDLEQAIHTGPLDPAVAFASQGSVLPARETRGLPVVSVNVPEVDVEFLRVRDTEVANFLVQFQRGGRRGGWDLDENRWNDRRAVTQMADPVYLNRFVLGGADNARQLTYLPVQNIQELRPPGLYFALLRRTGSYAGPYETAIFFVSDIGLHLRAYGDSVLVHTASLHSGKPIPSVTLEILDRGGQVVSRATTDRNGHALVAYRLDAGHVLVARKSGDVSLLPFNQPALDLSEFAVAGRPQAWFDVFAWSGRDLYRPGETVRVMALLRDHDGAPVKPQPLFMTLRQPDGKVFTETRLDPAAGGYLEWAQVLPPEAPTGRWPVEFRTAPGGGEVVQSLVLRIEEFLPERMKLELSAPPALTPGAPLPLGVEGAWLYGAPASGSRFTARLALAVDVHPVAAFPDHFFGDATAALPKDAADVVDQQLDAAGRLAVDLKLPAAAAAAATPVAVVVTGSLYESGGRPIVRSLKRTLWPARELIGVRPLFDPKEGAAARGNASFELIRSDLDGRLAAAERLQVALVRELRDYHWRQADDGWDYEFTARYVTVETRTVAARADGPLRLDFPVEWGEYRLEVTDPATQLTLRYPFIAGWSQDDQNRGPDARPDKVKVALDRTGYRAGDKLQVTVTPPQPGPGLLIVESDHLLHLESINARAGSTFELTVGADWERHDVYITALVFRGGSAKALVTPARAVGVARLPIDRQDRRVPVKLVAARQVVPEQALAIALEAPGLAGRKAWATVSAVDAGIVSITRFPVPDAAAHFFGPRRFGVDAYDLYGRVIGSYEGETARLRFGGDLALAALPQARRPTARVQTVDLYSGPVQLDARGHATVSLPVPDFNGTLRLSTVVFAEDRYGQAVAETIVRAPLLAELSAPRALAPGDDSTVTVDLQNFTGAAGDFALRLDTEGPLAVVTGHRRVRLAADERTSLRFAISGREGAGTAALRLRADGGGQRVDRRYEIAVRPAWGALTRSRAEAVQPGGALVLGTELAAGLMPGTVTARLTLSAAPPIPFARALHELLDYPYGCVEQTVSRGWAALLLDADGAAGMGITGLDDETRRRRIEGTLARLASLQIRSGHFSMWGGDGGAPILTPYIAEFLLRARDAGFVVPEALLQKTLERLSEDLLTGGPPFYGYAQSAHLGFAYQAHAGYVLARVNRAPLGTLRALYDNERARAVTALPLLQLGLALVLQGDAGRGDRAIAEALARKDNRPGWLGDYGSAVRDAALMLALLREHGRREPGQEQRLLALSRELQARAAESYAWYSTQEQIALARLGRALALDADRTFGGRLLAGGRATELPQARVQVREYSWSELAAGLRFEPRAEAPVFASIDIAGVPQAAPAPEGRNIRIGRRWFRTDGSPWSGGSLREGEMLVAALEIEAGESLPDALVVDLLPAGLEIENLNLTDPAQWEGISIDGIPLNGRASAADLVHEEFRDDRYVAALHLESATPARLFYLVRAVTPGSYAVPPPQVEDMYRPMLRGIGRAVPASITVVPP